MSLVIYLKRKREECEQRNKESRNIYYVKGKGEKLGKGRKRQIEREDTF